MGGLTKASEKHYQSTYVKGVFLAARESEII
jgi:hypothetical protein